MQLWNLLRFLLTSLLITVTIYSSELSIPLNEQRWQHERDTYVKLDCPPLSCIVQCRCEGTNEHKNWTSVGCNKCLPSNIDQDFVHSARSSRLPAKIERSSSQLPLYLILMVPPFWGSTALLGLLGTSPSVSTMCSHRHWMCESTWFLIHHFLIDKKDRWLEGKTNWRQVYKMYHEYGAWRNDKLPILVDKAPPNIAKSASLVRYLENERRMNRSDYRFIIMRHHPCLMKDSRYMLRDGNAWNLMAMHLLGTLHNVPADKRIIIDYHELITRPDLVAEQMVSWLPQLKQLDIYKSGIEEQDNDVRLLPIAQYAMRSECQIVRYRSSVLIHPDIIASEQFALNGSCSMNIHLSFDDSNVGETRESIGPVLVKAAAY